MSVEQVTSWNLDECANRHISVCVLLPEGSLWVGRSCEVQGLSCAATACVIPF